MCTRTRSALAVVFALVACSSSRSNNSHPGGDDVLAWSACPQDIPGSARATCSFVDVPLDWADPRGDEIQVFVRRFSPRGTPHGQLWALDGGPGEPGDRLTQADFVDPVLDAGYELLVPTHRGAAYGTTLACPGADDVSSCVEVLRAEWGEGLQNFSARQAGRDVAALAQSYSHADGGPVLIFGGSYGSVWLQRTLQAAPEAFDGAYVDSTGDMGMNFERIGEWFESAGQRVLARCQDTPACSAHFPDGLAVTAGRVQAAAASGEGCAATIGMTLPEVQGLFSALLQGTSERLFIAPLLHRLDRCSDADREVVLSLVQGGATPPTPPAATHFNILLNWVGTYRALYRVTVGPEALQSLSSGLLFDNGAMHAHAQRRPLFPEDFADRAEIGPTEYRGPLHIVQGDLDPLTPPGLATRVAARWTDSKLDYVIVPEGGHGSPRYTLRRDGERCGLLWLAAFLDDPSAPLDVDCLGDVPLVDWGMTGEAAGDLSEATWGARDPWG